MPQIFIQIPQIIFEAFECNLWIRIIIYYEKKRCCKNNLDRDQRPCYLKHGSLDDRSGFHIKKTLPRVFTRQGVWRLLAVNAGLPWRICRWVRRGESRIGCASLRLRLFSARHRCT